ncbi:MAG: NAD(P)-dependent oxidoreductase [Dongiaceae bacterium]
MERVLLTGASGGIGTRLRRMLPAHYPQLRLSDLKQPEDLQPGEQFVRADLADLAQVERALEGIEGIIHLGGQSIEAPWETVLNANIIGTYNLFEAARHQGVQRIVFASSNHVVGFYPRSRRLGTEAMLLPDTRYGVSKVCGEALGALYAYKFGLRVLCLRIGNFGDAPLDLRRMSIWLKPDDMVQLIRIGLEHPELRYEIFYGASNNTRGWWDNEVAYRYGYRPSGDSEPMLQAALDGEAQRPPDPVGDYVQGGGFASQEFDGDFDALREKG